MQQDRICKVTLLLVFAASLAHAQYNPRGLGGGGAPTGDAGGDLDGTYPNPIATRLTGPASSFVGVGTYWIVPVQGPATPAAIAAFDADISHREDGFLIGEDANVLALAGFGANGLGFFAGGGTFAAPAAYEGGPFGNLIWRALISDDQAEDVGIITAEWTPPNQPKIALILGDGSARLDLRPGHVDLTGAPVFLGATPTCGTGCASVVGNDRVADITVDSGTVTSVTLNFAATLDSTPLCVASTNAASVAAAVTAVSTTEVTIGTSASIGSGHLYVHCLERG